jgi:hypothetical protein
MSHLKVLIGRIPVATAATRIAISVTQGLSSGYFDAWVTHEPRCSGIGPSVTFAINAAPNRSTRNANATNSRHMAPCPFPHSIRVDAVADISSHDRP